MKMYIAGKWINKVATVDVINPYDGKVIDTVPQASIDDVDSAIASDCGRRRYPFSREKSPYLISSFSVQGINLPIGKHDIDCPIDTDGG